MTDAAAGNDPIRIGVFYDGGWLAHVSDFFATDHPRRARISLGGMHDAFRWYVHQMSGADLEACQVTEAHYVRGRSRTPSTVFDAVLTSAGVTRHDVDLYGGKEKGVDVYFALEVWERAVTTPLDCVVVVTGDADFVPLVTRLVSRGIWVIVPAIDADRGTAALHTATSLRQATPHAPSFDALFKPSELDDYPLRYPFIRAAESAKTPPLADGRWRGTVTRWQPGQTAGFITDRRGGSWFLSRDDLPDGLDHLAVGTAVSFTGSPKPPPGKPYPRAYSARIERA